MKKSNDEIKVAVYPDSFNNLKNIDIFPMSGISNKEKICLIGPLEHLLC